MSPVELSDSTRVPMSWMTAIVVFVGGTLLTIGLWVSRIEVAGNTQEARLEAIEKRFEKTADLNTEKLLQIEKALVRIETKIETQPIKASRQND